MNRRTIKRVKNPKSCGPCGHCIKEEWPSLPAPLYRCRVKPIMAQKENNCEQFQSPPTMIQQERPPDKEATDLSVVINNVVRPAFCRAYNYLHDLKNLNDSLSADSAVCLLHLALADLKMIADRMDINVED